MHIPTSLEEEYRILGAAMRSIDWTNELFAHLTLDHFFDSQNREIYSTMHYLYENDRTVDIDTIEAHASKDKLKAEHLINVYSLGNTSLHPGDLIACIKEAYKKRQLQEIASDILKHTETDASQSAEILRSLEDKIFNISQDKTSKILHTFKEASSLPPYLETIQTRQNNFRQGISSFEGHPTHYYDLDEKIKGLSPGHLTIIGARPGVGKTTFALNLMESLCFKSRCKCLFFSLEMPSREVIEKLVAQTAEIPFSKIAKGDLTGDEYQRIVMAYNSWLSKTLILDDQPALGIDQIKARAIRAQKTHKIDVIFIDYIQLVTSKRNNEARHLEIADISRKCKEIAKELKVPIIALAQLNREIEKRTDKRPFISDLRESGSLEADADEILLLHRPELYCATDKPGLIEVLVSKNRFGPTGNFLLTFNKECGVLKNYVFERP